MLCALNLHALTLRCDGTARPYLFDENLFFQFIEVGIGYTHMTDTAQEKRKKIVCNRL